MDSTICYLKMFNTALLFGNIDHLVVPADAAQQLENEAIHTFGELQSRQEPPANSIATLGQMFFDNFCMHNKDRPAIAHEPVFSPGWISEKKLSQAPVNRTQETAIQRGFQNLFRILTECHISKGLAKDTAVLRAQTETLFHYQWMIMNLVLPSIIDENLQTEILNSKAPLYLEFTRQNPVLPGETPIYPKEFVTLIAPVACFLCRSRQSQSLPFTQLIDELNLHRVPSAHDVINEVFKRTGILLDPPQSFQSTAHIPVWAFLISEMRRQDGYIKTGSLGSYILGDTITGLLMADPNTYWHQRGSDAGRWSPDDGCLDKAVDSLDKLLALYPPDQGDQAQLNRDLEG